MYVLESNRAEAISFQTSVNAHRVCQAINREFHEQPFRVVPNGSLYHIFNDRTRGFVSDYKFSN